MLSCDGGDDLSDPGAAGEIDLANGWMGNHSFRHGGSVGWLVMDQVEAAIR